MKWKWWEDPELREYAWIMALTLTMLALILTFGPRVFGEAW